jgi:phage terminase large subunit-like protein
LKLELADLLAEKQKRKARNKLAAYQPYSKQREFHAAGATYRERLLMAGNQLGKTYSGAAELSYHLTGRYPQDWQGKRYDRPVRFWAASKTGEVTRDGVQRLLVGEPKNESDWGTGFIPHADLKDWSRRQGVPDALDSVIVQHVSGGTSTLGFKSYDQGRQKFQGETLDGVWLDEEPDLDIYTECLTRTNATGGMVYLTFTPLLGMSDVVSMFLGIGQKKSPDRNVTTMTIEDAEHYTPQQRQQIIDSYPEHEREARTKGVPIMGSGRVFPISEESIKVDPFPIPDHWMQIGGLDFGWDHPFGATSIAWDRDSDIVYVTREYAQREATPVIHSAAIKPWGHWLPWSWPHDGLQHDKGSGESLAMQYRAQGLKMLGERATFPDGGNGVEAGVIEMFDRMKTGRWKVFSTCGKWFEEFRLYHRKDGLIVKERDDVISSSRYAYMMRRYGVAYRDAIEDEFGSDDYRGDDGRSGHTGY